MRRPAPLAVSTLATAALILACLAATGTAQAKRGGDDPSPGPTASASPSTSPGGSSRTTRVIARVSSAPQGGSLAVQVRVSHPTKGSAFAAQATATFASGAVTIPLRRAGKSYVALGRIPVPASQPAGPVSVTITVKYGSSTRTIARTVVVRPAGAGDDASPSPSASPSATP